MPATISYVETIRRIPISAVIGSAENAVSCSLNTCAIFGCSVGMIR